MSRTLQAPVTVAFDYTRSVGPVLGRFLTGLRDRQVIGARLADGRVVVPPPEFDPITHRAPSEYVDLPDTGVVTSWTWVTEPVAGQPFDRPFAFALVTLDGADTPWLQAVDVASPEEMSTGMRVRARWVDEPVGMVTDLVFVAGAADATGLDTPGLDTPGLDTPGLDTPGLDTPGLDTPSPSGSGYSTNTQGSSGYSTNTQGSSGYSTNTQGSSAYSTSEGVTTIVTPTSVDYTYAASPEESAFFRGLAEGRILAQRCPVCQKVYVPPRPACPVDGVPTEGEIELPDVGTVTTFCVVNVPFLGQKITPPYVSAYILLDGADIALMHLILDIPAAEVRMGMRVKAVWKPREEWGTTIENISHFAPTDEPDADFDTYRSHL